MSKVQIYSRSGKPIKTKYKSGAVSLKNVKKHTSYDSFLELGTNAVYQINIPYGVKVGDEVIIGSVLFTGVERFSETDSVEGQFKIGDTEEQTASNLTTAILTHPSKALQQYKFSVLSGVPSANSSNMIIVTQKSASTKGISLITPQGSSISIINKIAGISGAIDVTGIKNMDDFIGAMSKAEFSCVGQCTGCQAKGMAIDEDNGNVISCYPFHAGDSVAVYRLAHNKTIFQGALFQVFGGGLYGAQLKMTDRETDQYFIINFSKDYSGRISSYRDSVSVSGDLNDLWQSAIFQQTRTLDIDYQEDIFFGETVVGSTKGIVASLTSTDFTNLEFTDFSIMPSKVNEGGVKFTATISDIKISQIIDSLLLFPKELIRIIVNYIADPYNLDDTAESIHKYIQGYRLDLIQEETGNILSINIGQRGLKSLINTKNFEVIQEAFKQAFVYEQSKTEIDKIKLTYTEPLKPTLPLSDDSGVTIDLAGSLGESLQE